MTDWDERHRRGEHAGAEPSRLLVRAVEEFAPAPAGDARGRRPRALDIACGAGRHAVYLAGRGFEVTAVDISRVAVELTKERARERGLEVDARVADLTRGEFTIEPEAYAVVCDFQYLQRDLFPPMRAAIVRGGLFVASIHTEDERAGVRPMNPDFLLHPGELRARFRDWQILHYHEGEGQKDREGRPARRAAEIIARRPEA